jgi:hypothetical protein
MRPYVFSPEYLTPEERAREVARILATGLLRHVRNATAIAVPVSHAPLELPGSVVSSGTGGRRISTV